MSETNTPNKPEQKEQPYNFNLDAANLKINAVKKYYESFIGKEGHNPYTYMKDVITPLVVRLNQGERTKQLFTSILALEEKAPKVEIKRGDVFETATTSTKFAEDIPGNEPKEIIQTAVKKG